MKVKIVQIALAVATDSVNGVEERSEYLDDKGRVWYQVAVYKKMAVGTSVSKEFSHYEWKQVDLPEEPQE